MTAVRHVKNRVVVLDESSRAADQELSERAIEAGLHWAAYIEVDSAYNWDPATRVEGIPKENMLGVEAPLWSETVTNMDDIEYLVFPRLPGYAEIGWSPAEGRTWEEYKVRLGKHAAQMKALDIDFYKSKLVPWVE